MGAWLVDFDWYMASLKLTERQLATGDFSDWP